MSRKQIKLHFLCLLDILFNLCVPHIAARHKVLYSRIIFRNTLETCDKSKSEGLRVQNTMKNTGNSAALSRVGEDNFCFSIGDGGANGYGS